MNQVLAKLRNKEVPIVVVGLGYVGLPLACLLAKKFKVIGFDINETRVKELSSGYDRTKEIEDKKDLLQESIVYSSDPRVISDSRFIIVAVPTPIDEYKKPDLTPILSASRTIGKHLKPNSIVVFESTVYPGLTENECRSTIEKESGLLYGKDFHLGYSPERVNPGDKKHTIDKIIKVVSGSNAQVTDIVADVYSQVVTAGIHRAPTIKTAEAAKVIENTQRDLNIALINELSRIFERVGLDTKDVLEAAGTKWNFLPFTPGLVGGHCIGVDPFYLTHLAQSVNYNPQVILAGRGINDSMGKFVAEMTVKHALKRGPESKGNLRILVLGVTFKENVPDLRNSKVIDVINELEEFNCDVYLFDPIADKEEFEHEYHKSLCEWESIPKCDAVVMAVKHSHFIQEFGVDVLLTKLESENPVIIDLHGIVDRKEAADKDIRLWRL